MYYVVHFPHKYWLLGQDSNSQPMCAPQCLCKFPLGQEPRQGSLLTRRACDALSAHAASGCVGGARKRHTSRNNLPGMIRTGIRGPIRKVPGFESAI